MSKQWKKIQLWEKIVLGIIIFSALTGGLILGFIISEVKNQTALEKLVDYQPKMPTRLYDIKGRVISELFREKRELVTFNELPPHLINAFLAVEDGNFFNHFGIDFEGILRAAFKNIRAGRIVQGGSTLTQQLVKGLFTKGEKTFLRKSIEAVYALQIEKEFSKQEILEMYFNQIYFGHGAYGIKSAARFYFNKDVKDLSFIESAILAALPKSPHSFSPIRSTHESYKRNRVVLNLMIEKGFITKEKADQEYKEFWPQYIAANRHRPPTETAFGQKFDHAPYFTDHVRQILIARFGEEKVYNEGLQVYTTLDLDRQKAAQRHLWETLERYDKSAKSSNRYYSGGVDRGLFGSYNVIRSFVPLPALDVRNTIEGIYKREVNKEIVDDIDIALLMFTGGQASHAMDGYRRGSSGLHSNLKVQGAIISIEPRTGYISSMVGGTPFSPTNQFNRAVQARRQPGSSFKPFVYTAAIDSRIYATGSVELDAPMTHVDEAGGTWSPENYGHGNRGPVTLKQALAASLNIISVRLFDRIGPDRIIDIASRMMRISPSRFTPNPALSLGGSEVTPLELATGFAVFANDGKEVIPFAIRYINNRDGNQIINTENEIRHNLAIKDKDGSIQILPKALNWIMADLLQFVVKHGTASTIRHSGGFLKPAGGKTGTTSNWADGWFAGFTPDLTTVVWLGYDDRSLTLGAAGTGGSSAAPLFGRYMADALAQTPATPFPKQPPGVYAGGFCTICNGWPSEHCPADKRTGGYFLKGFGAPRCPKEKWVYTEYTNIEDRFKEIHGLDEEALRKRLEEKYLGKDKPKDSKNKDTKQP